MYVIFINYPKADGLFAAAIRSHLNLSKQNVAKKLFQEWLEDKKTPELLQMRPLLSQVGGRKLRKSIAGAYKDAHTWWFEAAASPREFQKLILTKE